MPISNDHLQKLLELQKWCLMLSETGYANKYLHGTPEIRIHNFITGLFNLPKLYAPFSTFIRQLSCDVLSERNTYQATI